MKVETTAIAPAKPSQGSSFEFDDSDFFEARFDPTLNAPLPSSKDCQLSFPSVLRGAFAEGPITNPNFAHIFRAVSDMKQNFPNGMDMDSLLEWEETMRATGQHDPDMLKKAFLILNPKSVATRAGLDPLLWAHLSNFGSICTRDVWHRAFMKKCGHSIELCQAASAELYEGSPRRTDASLKNYEIMRLFCNDPSIGGFVSNLSDFRREGRSVSASQLFSFALDGIMIRSDRHGYGYNNKFGHASHEDGVGDVINCIFLDAPLGVVLKHRDVPVAVYGFVAEHPKVLFINEIQAVRPKMIVGENGGRLNTTDLSSNHWELEPFRWREFMLYTVATIAQSFGFEEIRIQSAENNRWCKPDRKNEIHLPFERAEKMYDRFAESLNMRRGADGNFEASVNKLLDLLQSGMAA